MDLDPLGAADRVVQALDGGRGVITYRVWVDDSENYLSVREQLVRDGYRRLWLDGDVVDIDKVKPSQTARAGRAQVVVDRITGASADRGRVAAAVEEAWNHAAGAAHLHRADSAEKSEPLLFRRGLSCPTCARVLSSPAPGLFSYESPLGACPSCKGFGRTIGVDVHKVIPNPDRTLARGAIRPWTGRSTSWERTALGKLCRRNDIPMDRPWRELSAEQQRLVVQGDGDWDEGLFPGVLGWFKWLETKTYKMHVRVFLARYRSYDPCVDCGGKRLNEHALSYWVDGIDIAGWHALEVREGRARLDALRTKTGQGEIARKELASRLGYLERVGLGYLTLDRQARTLSGGEAQRVTLTAALGTSLHNALFVLDEPTVGLHPTDVAPLAEIVRELAQRDNVVLVVEHDPTMIASADRAVELGPGAGAQGGRIVGDGTPAELLKGDGATARALRGIAAASRAARRASGQLRVRGARQHNLKSIDVDLPLGVICALTGASGSGKSTLAVDIVYRCLARRLGAYDVELPGEHDALDGAEAVKRVTLVDQAPLGRTSRGNAATYTKAWDCVRKLLASQPASFAQGFGPSTFSFNVDGGRCEACAGEGSETVEMQFLADVRLVCPSCRGQRFKDEVLTVEHGGKNVAELLRITVDEALQHFRNEVAIQRALGPLAKLGLGYLSIGQPLSTLSGGEAQRLKLARALGEDHRGALLILDEPSAGLHADEVARLLEALDVIIAGGGSVLVVEHDLDVIARADWIVDLGPDGGAGGGQVVTTGTPASVGRTETRTGRALAAHGKQELRPARKAVRSAEPPALSVVHAREHNLAGVSAKVPHGALTVVTGPSGSGKSTLAFDVIFAEGQRRFLETLTPYARQFLPTMPRPDVDSVVGVPPSVALEQRTTRAGAKSTVATVTEVAHYLRLLYAKLGVPHCPDHDEPIQRRSAAAVEQAVRAERGKYDLLAPVVEARKGTYLDVFTAAARDGITRAWCDGERVSTDRPPRLAKTKEHTIELLIVERTEPRRLDAALLARALKWGRGTVKLRDAAGHVQRFSTRSACPKCGFSVPELDPRFFSFNTAQGKCARCDGDGVVEARRKRGSEPALVPCPECGGSRLAPVPRAVRVHGERYHDVVGRSVSAALARVGQWRFEGDALRIAGPIVDELVRRLSFLRDVGLDYLSLDRAARTLSGGEMQRLRLAAQLGAGLTGALYVLDEPTIGLHPRDTGRLLDNLRKLVGIGSTVLVVEHDADTIRAADHLIDLGPGGGVHGGRVVAEGPPKKVLRLSESPTGRALAAPPDLRRPLAVRPKDPRLELLGAAEHNLKSIDVSIPLGRFVVVAGVSGSGKSTLVRQVLLPALRKRLKLVTEEEPGAHRDLRGFEKLCRAVSVDQSPIGRTPRSVPATFLGIWNAVRTLFAATTEAKMAGFGAARFSFNTASGGRCPTCEGQGVITHEMSFLPDVIARCPTCEGARFEPRTLEVKYLGYSIGEVLGLTAEEGAHVFRNHRNIAAPLRTLVDLGAGYIQIGQGSHTLSGGEAQRLKLAAELTASTRHEPTLYVLDEPTTGLHLADVSRLMHVLGRLIERGDTLVVIEHHPVVMAGADWLIELGPEGGEGGGRMIASGTPREVAKKKTPTAKVLREVFGEGAIVTNGARV